MADINHVISLGIGSPAAIPEFLTFGLQIAADVSSNALFITAANVSMETGGATAAAMEIGGVSGVSVETGGATSVSMDGDDA